MTRSLRQTLESHGFVLDKHRGGNCSAYVRADGDGLEEVITVADDAAAPTRLTDKVAVWTGYPEAGDEGTTEKATAEEVVAALNHPSDEYFLLSLRIENLVRSKEAA